MTITLYVTQNKLLSGYLEHLKEGQHSHQKYPYDDCNYHTAVLYTTSCQLHYPSEHDNHRNSLGETIFHSLDIDNP